MNRSFDPSYSRRIAVAIALSLAVHEIAAGFAHWPHAETKPEVVARAERVSIVTRTPAPSPTPEPTARITPPPVVETPQPMVRFTVAPRIVVAHESAPKAAARLTNRHGGAAAPVHVVHVPPPARPSPVPVPVVAMQNGANAGAANGGSGTGAGAGTGDGGDAGTANGTGGSGTENGDPASPCGDVDFHPMHLAVERGGGVEQQVAVTLMLRNGQDIDGLFPYAFKYPSEDQNPFHNDAMLVNGGIAVQFPPRGFDLASAPPAVQLVLKYSDPATGLLQLPKCPPETGSNPTS